MRSICLSGGLLGSLSHTDKIHVVKTHPIMLWRTCSIEGFPTLKTLDFSSKAVFHISKCLLFIMSSRYNQRSYSFSQAVSINRPTPPPTPRTPTHLRSKSYRGQNDACVFMNPTSVFLFYTVCVTGMLPLVSFLAEGQDSECFNYRLFAFLSLTHTHR